jgi:ABC-type transport system involved in cytochrome bd biosynthesis fused ATPase/permease subunit
MEIALAISILSVVITVLNFVLSRKDKAVKDKEEQNKENTNQQLIDYRLGQVEKKLDKILDILDSYEEDTKKIVNEEMEKHILKYHGEKK